MARNWSGVIAVEGRQTGDGRLIADGALYWENLPVPLRWDVEDDGGHSGAVVVGTIDQIERREGGMIWAAGTIDDAPPADENIANWGAEAVRLMAEGVLKGVSIDPDDWQVAVIDTTVTEADAAEAEAELMALLAAAGDPDPGPDAGVVLFEDEAGAIIERLLRGRIRAATLVDTPAFIDAVITLDDAEAPAEGEAPVEDEPVAVAAAEGHADCGCGGSCGDCGSTPVVVHADGEAMGQIRFLPLVAAASSPFDVDLFHVPPPDKLTPITRDGQAVFGHVAQHDTCHVGVPGACTTAPMSASGYAHFHRYAETKDGTPLPVNAGRITGGHGQYANVCSCCPGSDDHACVNWEYAETIAHHDQMPTLAYGRVVEDTANNAIWFSGIVAPEASEADVALLDRQLVSGDWEPVGWDLELTEVLALSKERPGFPLALVAHGRVRALVAAGTVRPEAPAAPAPANSVTAGPVVVNAPSAVDIGEAVAAALAAREAAPHRRKLAAIGRERSAEQRADALARLRG